MVKPAASNNQSILDAMTAKAKARAAANGGAGLEPYDPKKRKDSVVSVSGIFFHGKNEADEFGEQVSQRKKDQIKKNIDRQQKKRRNKNGKLIAEETDSVISSDDDEANPFDSGDNSSNQKIPNLKNGRTGERKSKGKRSSSGPNGSEEPVSVPKKSPKKTKMDRIRENRLLALNKDNAINIFKGGLDAIKAEQAKKKSVRTRYKLPAEIRDLDDSDEGDDPSVLNKSSKTINIFKAKKSAAGDQSFTIGKAAAVKPQGGNAFNNIFKRAQPSSAAKLAGSPDKKPDAPDGPSPISAPLNIFKK